MTRHRRHHGASIVTDPEMVLPEDPIPGPIIAMSNMCGGIFPTVEALIEHRTQVETHLALQMSESQRGLTTPCWVAFDVLTPNGAVLHIFGHVPSLDEVVERESEGEEPGYAEHMRHRLENLNLRGWLFGHWHSLAAPEGEWGCISRAAIHTCMGEDDFMYVAQHGWDMG